MPLLNDYDSVAKNILINLFRFKINFEGRDRNKRS